MSSKKKGALSAPQRAALTALRDGATIRHTYRRDGSSTVHIHYPIPGVSPGSLQPHSLASMHRQGWLAELQRSDRSILYGISADGIAALSPKETA